MNYYILPKNNNIFKLCPKLHDDIINNITPYTSYSLFKNYNDIMLQIKDIEKEYSTEFVNNILKLVHSHEYIFSFIPGTKICISKLKACTNVFYDLYEILLSLNIFEQFTSSINALYISENCDDMSICHNLLRKDNCDTVINIESIDNNITDVKICSYNFIFYQIENKEFYNINQYIIQLFKILRIILLNQTSSGICILKIDTIFYKPIIDILYILCSLYEKVGIIKPNTSNITSFEKYIVCSNFILSKEKKELYNNYIMCIDSFLSEYEDEKNKNIISIILNDIPAYFLNKIDDISIIFGQQQLETIDQIINILKNKNKDEKIEFLKKTNIQKSISWCEKFRVPYFKFSEKPNIFLPLQQNIDIHEENINENNIYEENTIINENIIMDNK
jgi:hypothetical protein